MISHQSQKRKSRSSALLVLALVITIAHLSITVPASAYGSTVRGRLDRRSGNGTYPAANVKVTVYNTSAGRSSPAYTVSNGMYYIYNIPAGDYYLEVWVSDKPIFYRVQVSNQAYTDIAPIVLP